MKIDIDMATITLDEISSLMIMLNDLRNRKEVERRKFERNDREFRESLYKEQMRRQQYERPTEQFAPITKETGTWIPEEVSSEIERLREERLAQQSQERRERRKQERKKRVAANPCDCKICTNYRKQGDEIKALAESIPPDDDSVVEDFMDSDREEKKE